MKNPLRAGGYCNHKWESGRSALKRLRSGPDAGRLLCELCARIIDGKMLQPGADKMMKPELAKNK